MVRVALAAVVAVTVLLGGGAAAGIPTCPGGLVGKLAYVDQGLRVLDMRTCRVRVLVSSKVRPPVVRWSHDGRWLAFGEGGVVAASGGRVLRPIGYVRAWTWSPLRDVLVGVSARGAIVASPPGGRRRRLATGFDDTFYVALDPTGRRLAVGRDQPSELWVIDVASGARMRLAHFASRYGGLTIAGWSPDGRWLLFWGPYPGASIAADGIALNAIPVGGGPVVKLANSTLLYEDFLSWCGRTRLVVSAGFDRYSTSGKTLVAVTAPRWRASRLVGDRALSWVTPTCSPNGQSIAAAAGRNFEEPRFGLEHRSLWLVPASGGPARQLTIAPTGATDEHPIWLRDGRSLLFVRTRHFHGKLLLAGLNGGIIGPIADLGSTGSYYGHYGWADQLDWYQPSTSK